MSTRRDVAKCKGCGASIIWDRTPAGKMMPRDVDTGQPHWETCPNKEEFKPRKGAAGPEPRAGITQIGPTRWRYVGPSGCVYECVEGDKEWTLISHSGSRSGSGSPS